MLSFKFTLRKIINHDFIFILIIEDILDLFHNNFGNFSCIDMDSLFKVVSLESSDPQIQK